MAVCLVMHLILSPTHIFPSYEWESYVCFNPVFINLSKFNLPYSCDLTSDKLSLNSSLYITVRRNNCIDAREM